MQLHFTRHARKCMAARNVSERVVVQAMASPDSIVISEKLPIRRIAKKWHVSADGRAHILVVIYEPLSTEDLLIITVIDTSKIAKYSRFL